ncbi:NPCBM/NEW2 domain-containing protein [Pendulispora rubella]|uniref:Alpha-galactosidase n=1 Tax=Pendulispora rubella TaxID=2741070 RepID=A0ABZ2L4H4_9BACT
MSHRSTIRRAVLRSVITTTSLLAIACSSTPSEEASAQSSASLASLAGLAPKPPLGWNSWNKYGCDINEAKIKAATDAMVSSGMKDAGYEYVNIDDCWAELNRDANGKLVPHRTRFPGGIKALADYVHGKGLKLGIYTSAGSQTCAKTMPGALKHEQDDANSFASWGVDYLKYDNCNHDGTPAKQRYQAMGTALANSGRHIVYSICNWGEEDPWVFGPQVGGDLWRTTGDISDNWNSVLSLLDQQNGLEPFARQSGWNDPDMLEVGNGGMTTTEYRAHFSLWALLNAPLLAGNDLSAMSADTKAILTNRDIIAVDQDWGGSQGRLLRDLGNGTQVWGKPMSDGSVAIVLFNRNGATSSITTSAAEIGLGGSSSYRLKDLWSKAESTTSGSISASVPSHGAAMYIVRREGTLATPPAPGTYALGDATWLTSSNGWGPVERNKSNGETASNDGRGLSIASTAYAKGIGAHANSAVHVYLGKTCSRFRAQVGIDAESGTRGSVRFQVYGDGKLLSYTDVKRGGQTASALDIATTGVTALELRVTDARDNKDYDHADWAGAEIVCN